MSTFTSIQQPATEMNKNELVAANFYFSKY